MTVDGIVLDKLQRQLLKVDELCVPSPDMFQVFVDLLKLIYDYASALSDKQFGPFKQLLVHDLDIESIWELIQTRSKPLIRNTEKSIRLLNRSLLTDTTLSSNNNAVLVSKKTNTQSVSAMKVKLPDKKLMKSETNSLIDLKVKASKVHSRNEDDDVVIERRENDYVEFDDEDMDEWLDEAERAEEYHIQRMEKLETERGHKGAAEEDDSAGEDDDIEFVQKALYEDDDEEIDVSNVRYDDFFGGKRESANSKRGTRKGELTSSAKKYVAEEEDEEADEGEDEEGEGNEEDQPDDEDKITAVPRAEMSERQRRIAEEISGLEMAAVAPKSWEYRGEVRGQDRPVDSLLTVTADVDRASKPVPIITQSHSSSIEEIIKKRIKDNNFNNVKPASAHAQPKASKVDLENEPQLSQEKSSIGLGQIYAEEFMKKTLGLSADIGTSGKPSAAEGEVTELFQKVCRELDALSHFNFCPRPVVIEAKVTVVKALPAITFEDINPTVESLASGLAPEEVLSKKRGRSAALLSEAELDRDDRNRLRRASKATRRSKRAREGVVAGGSYSREKDGDILKDKRVKIKDDSNKNVIVDDSTRQSFKSAEFFSRMQQQAKDDISATIKKSSSLKGSETSGRKSSQVKL